MPTYLPNSWSTRASFGGTANRPMKKKRMIGQSTLATVTSTQPPSSQSRLPTTISAMSSSSTSSRMISASTPEGASRTCSVTMDYLR